MTALVDAGHVRQKNYPFNNFRTTDLRFTSQAFGREPNALAVRALASNQVYAPPSVPNGKGLPLSLPLEDLGPV